MHFRKAIVRVLIIESQKPHHLLHPKPSLLSFSKKIVTVKSHLKFHDRLNLNGNSILGLLLSPQHYQRLYLLAKHFITSYSVTGKRERQLRVNHYSSQLKGLDQHYFLKYRPFYHMVLWRIFLIEECNKRLTIKFASTQ